MKPFLKRLQWSGYGKRWCSSSTSRNTPLNASKEGIHIKRRTIPPPVDTDGLPPILDTPAPPRPPSYVPPSERHPDDESLAFMKEGSPLDHIKSRIGEDDTPILERGQKIAPSLPDRPKHAPRYMTEKAERIKSTSVHAGESLLESRKVVDSGEYYFHDNTTTSLPEGEAELERENFSRLKQLKESRPRADRKAAADGTAEGEDLGRSGPSVFDESVKADENPAQPWEKPQLSPSQQMSLELKKLEYYEGSPKYPEMLREFLEKYGGDSPEQEVDEAKAYSKEEVEMGLEAQPLDYLRGSSKLQAHLLSGARQYDPITVMQQQGVMRFQGYAFPPSTELGKLKNIEDVKSVVDSHKDKSFLSSVRRSFNALTGKQSDKDDYVATGDKPVEDTHLLYRTLGLDAVQRRQMRFMLTDFDYADRQTAFHVMMTYPYTDWIHVIYMVLVGVALYELQVRYEAYEFYDEYMGLDLRQVPGMKKPLLAAITIGVMVFFLFQPLLVASIATTRAYRIVMKRPIGPP